MSTFLSPSIQFNIQSKQLFISFKSLLKQIPLIFFNPHTKFLPFSLSLPLPLNFFQPKLLSSFLPFLFLIHYPQLNVSQPISKFVQSSISLQRSLIQEVGTPPHRFCLSLELHLPSITPGPIATDWNPATAWSNRSPHLGETDLFADESIGSPSFPPPLLLSFKLLCFSRDVEEKRGIRIRGIFRGSTFMGGSGDRSRLILSLLSDMESSGARERRILTRVWDS